MRLLVPLQGARAAPQRRPAPRAGVAVSALAVPAPRSLSAQRVSLPSRPLRLVLVREASEGAVEAVAEPPLSLAELSERLGAASQSRQRAKALISSLEAEAVLLASQVATTRVAEEQAQGEATVAMARAGTFAADVLAAEQELATAREALEVALEEAEAARLNDEKERARKAKETASASAEPADADWVASSAPPPADTEGEAAAAAAAAADSAAAAAAAAAKAGLEALQATVEAAESKVAALDALKTEAENLAQAVAERVFSAQEAFTAAQERETAVKEALAAAKSEEALAGETLLASETALAELRAREGSSLLQGSALSESSQAALKAAKAAEEAAAAAATAAALALAAAQGTKLSAEQIAQMADTVEAADSEAVAVSESSEVALSSAVAVAAAPAPAAVAEVREEPRFFAGAPMSGSTIEKIRFDSPGWVNLRSRLGPLGVGLLIAASLSLVVEMPVVRRLWKGGKPPVAHAISEGGQTIRASLKRLRSFLPDGEHRVVEPAAAAAHAVKDAKALKGKAAPAAAVKGGKAAKAKEAVPAPAHAAAAKDHADGHGGAAAGMTDVITLLATSVLIVPLICKVPGGSPVLGFLVGGALIGPMALGLIANVETVKHIAEIGVVFLLFNIGLELSFDKLRSLAKYVFGLGLLQVVATTVPAALIVSFTTGISLPAAAVVGVGFAFSSTAVAMQVLGDRGEAASRHGRVAFSVLLLQDLAVVLVFMLVPLLGGPDGGASGLTLLKAVGTAVVKTAAAVGCIMAVGRVVLRPVYRRIAELGNTEIFSATTLLVALGTSGLTAALGLSAALGAFLAGLLLAETEYHLQVESDIAPYRGLLLGLFFMTVGMTIDPALLVARFAPICASIALLVVGKVAVMCLVGLPFGLSLLNSARAGMYIGPGGEFAFVTYGLAVGTGLLSAALVNELTLVIALSMAVTPFLAQMGADLRDRLETADMKSLAPASVEVDDLSKHVIIAGYGRAGQLIAQLLTEQNIPYVALDMRSDRVQEGREEDVPVYFGDAGSETVLHSVGAARAACAVVCMDTAGANYRTVYTLHKHYPQMAVYVRAADIADGIKLERAGATACVPETLEPSLQLAAAVLQSRLPPDEASAAIDAFRRRRGADVKAAALAAGAAAAAGTH